jgi:2-amino-4-hydroxy-6-hydroxymethyldihydropteridine diphosphokinase
MPTAFLGLGSNIGDRKANLARAVAMLAAHPQIEVVDVSSIHETEPVGYTKQPDFLNAVARVETTLRPRELLDVILAIEAEMGRERTIRWGPRVIDIDILLFDGEQVDEPGLQIPHPRMMERQFVLDPLAEIAPDLVLPNGRTARQASCEL